MFRDLELAQIEALNAAWPSSSFSYCLWCLYNLVYNFLSFHKRERMTQSHAMPLGGFVCILSLTLYSKKTNPTAI